MVVLDENYTHHLSRQKKHKKKVVFFVSLIAFVVLILLGTIGYKLLFSLSWLDAFYNAAAIFSGGSKVADQTTGNGQKMFIIVYTLLASVVFIGIAATAIKDIIDLWEED